jgi:hypothetical protein
MLYWILEASDRMQGTCESPGGVAEADAGKCKTDRQLQDEPNAYKVLVDHASKGMWTVFVFL